MNDNLLGNGIRAIGIKTVGYHFYFIGAWLMEYISSMISGVNLVILNKIQFSQICLTGSCDFDGVSNTVVFVGKIKVVQLIFVGCSYRIDVTFISGLTIGISDESAIALYRMRARPDGISVYNF